MFQDKRTSLQRDELSSFPASPALLTAEQEMANPALGDYLGPGLAELYPWQI